MNKNPFNNTHAAMILQQSTTFVVVSYRPVPVTWFDKRLLIRVETKDLRVSMDFEDDAKNKKG